MVKIKQTIEGNTLLTREQSLNIRGSVAKIKSEYESHIEEKDTEIQTLKNLLKQKNTNAQSAQKVEEIKAKKTKKTLKLDQISIDVLLIIANNEGYEKNITINKILANLAINSKIKAALYVEKLTEKEYVMGNKYGHCYLTTKGKEFLVDEKLID